ncbi:hypothetical protein UFOVP1229_18 [uncultured Caudovirales phage]|uniref:Uncharacterized protein n=1 Tax=uncultured Caudovirales phage TaxID=2100421 RepID=A0A6J5RG59_9CAUD|nr:hypothetical protein UFOVP1229_18 [uncultured Caudovirales phage]
MIELKGLFPVKKQTKKAAPRAATKKGGVGLLDIAKSVAPKNPNWIDTVTPEQRAEIIDTCRAIISGEINGSVRAIAEAWQAHGIGCSRNKLTDLIARVRRGEVK